MEIVRFILVLLLTLTSSDFVKGRRIQLMSFFMLLSGIIYRSGGDFPLSGSTSLSSRRSTGTDV